MLDQPWKDEGMNKAEWVAMEVARAVNAGHQWELETVDFADPDRPLTCLETDFPIIPINQIAAIEGNAGKPIYQMSKWWARRRSSVFRSMLLAAATKAPDDPSEAAKVVWDAYYGNHQAKGAFSHLKVADIFMGGGTTVVEGSRLGMQMFGNDLNPVAWFIVKNEMAQVDREAVEALLAEIEAEVKPQIMPFYACDCPRGHKGKWTRVSDGQVMGDDFDAAALPPEERKGYSYEGPEIIYVFWAKHGPCQVTGCGHRTPIMSTPVVAVKTLSVKTWNRRCKRCGGVYDLEDCDARMAPGVPLVVTETERPYAVAGFDLYGQVHSVACPLCGQTDAIDKLPKALGKGRRKKIELSLLVHPDWLCGEASKDAEGRSYGGSADDEVEATVRWHRARASKCKLIEVRGKLPDKIKCPDTGSTFWTGKDGGTVPKKSKLACGNCGSTADVLGLIQQYGYTAPLASYAIQGYCPTCGEEGQPYRGRFFAPVQGDKDAFSRAAMEWATRMETEGLSDYAPTDSVPLGLETSVRTPLHKYGYRSWHSFFNERQLLVLTIISRHIRRALETAREPSYVAAGALQQFSRSFNMFTIWNIQADKLEPMFSKNNLQPPTRPVSGNPFSDLGRGNFRSCMDNLPDALHWKECPWELVSVEQLDPHVRGALGKARSAKVFTGDPTGSAEVTCMSSTELQPLGDESHDLVITDPPFGDIMQYGELSGLFYSILRRTIPTCEHFHLQAPPVALEAVENYHRHGKDSETFYKSSLTACWAEARRILKPGGLLAFTFHHDKDRPWVAVLESLFDAGFYLQATFPIRSDETKGAGSTPGTFGAQKVEYDIIHVCRKRNRQPTPISWAKLRRQILRDVRDLQELLEHHSEEGLPDADLQVIRRGKALEYFSRHYGQVFKEPGKPMTVLEALVGVNQLLEEESGGATELPPNNAEPFTRMLLRLFDGITKLQRDQMQKFLRGTGCAPSDFLAREWLTENRKVFYLVPPLELAQGWIGKKRKSMTSDYDQAMFFIGSCHEGSGINVNDTLNNPNFRPHPALGELLQWFRTHGGDSATRNAASIAVQLYRTWESRNAPKAQQVMLFDFMGEEEQ